MSYDYHGTHEADRKLERTHLVLSIAIITAYGAIMIAGTFLLGYFVFGELWKLL